MIKPTSAVCVLLICLAAAASAQLEPEQVQKCLKQYLESIDAIKIPAEIQEIAQYVRGHDKSGSLSVADILTNQKINIRDLIKNKPDPERSTVLAMELINKFFLIPNDCTGNYEFYLETEKIKEDNNRPGHATINKRSDYMKLCIEIVKASNEESI